MGKVRNYHVFKHSDMQIRAVLINPSAYKIGGILGGRPKPECVVAFTGNYNWLGVPIGFLQVNDFNVPSMNIHLGIRPVFAYDEIAQRWVIVMGREYEKDARAYTWAFQAGPTLVWDGKISVGSEQEKFRSDAIRPTNQGAVGITRSGKIVILYSLGNRSLTYLAHRLIDFGCYRAMKVDSGSAGVFVFNPDLDDTDNTPQNLGHPYRMPVGIQFLKK
jgi:hypothetical protein